VNTARTVLAAATLSLACHDRTPAPPNAGPTAASPLVPTVPTASSSATPIPRAGTRFDDDLAFLSQHGALKVLSSPSGGKIAVSGDYQARVLTSELESGGQSLGFINRKFIEDGKTGTQFDNYGGEDRFWLGPEGGQYALFFAPKKPFTFENWQTPHSLQEGAWQLTSETPTSLTYDHSMTLPNYSGRVFKVEIERRISVLSPEQASERLGMPVPASVHWVGFSTSNRLKNTGSDTWTEAGGGLSVWILGMFAPVSGTRVIIPFDNHATGEVVNDRYFGKVPADRLTVAEQAGYLLFKCDGQYRSKIGLGPARAKAALGSYSESAGLLTLILYTKPTGATRYVNSMWETQKEPYGGDVVNSYNDGPPAPGKPATGGFYEIESSSPAAALAPGASLTHVHQTYHFSGPRDALDALARHVLGVGLSELPKD
jgi:hypothetical protein